MNPLSVPVLEGLLLIAQLTVIFLWAVLLVGIAVRVIVGSFVEALNKTKGGYTWKDGF